MAKQINTKVTAPTPELSESTELNKAEHAETGAGIEKQADNASEEPEKPSETEPGHESEEQQEPEQDKVQAAGVLVKYIGASIWRDEEGKYWASEEPEKPSETEPGHESEEQQEPEQDKVQAAGVLVKYIGASIWRDEEGKYWASEKKSDNILTERQFTAEEYDRRDDIKFMVQYGEMKATELHF